MNKAKTLMVERGWSVSDLMFEARVARNTANKVATSEPWPDRFTPYGTIEDMAKAFGVSPADLVSNEVPPGNNKGSGQ